MDLRRTLGKVLHQWTRTKRSGTETWQSGDVLTAMRKATGPEKCPRAQYCGALDSQEVGGGDAGGPGVMRSGSQGVWVGSGGDGGGRSNGGEGGTGVCDEEILWG